MSQDIPDGSSSKLAEEGHKRLYGFHFARVFKWTSRVAALAVATAYLQKRLGGRADSLIEGILVLACVAVILICNWVYWSAQQSLNDWAYIWPFEWIRHVLPKQRRQILTRFALEIIIPLAILILIGQLTR
jgi:hypothetical protein